MYELLKERDQEIENYKRNIKLTKQEESEKELETVYSECARLRRMLEDSEKNVARLFHQISSMKGTTKNI